MTTHAAKKSRNLRIMVLLVFSLVLFGRGVATAAADINKDLLREGDIVQIEFLNVYTTYWVSTIYVGDGQVVRSHNDSDGVIKQALDDLLSYARDGSLSSQHNLYRPVGIMDVDSNGVSDIIIMNRDQLCAIIPHDSGTVNAGGTYHYLVPSPGLSMSMKNFFPFRDSDGSDGGVGNVHNQLITAAYEPSPAIKGE